MPQPRIPPTGARPPRLLIVVNVPWFFVMHRMPIATMARARGVDVHIACADGEGRHEIEASGFPFHALPLTRSPLAPWRDLRTLISLTRLYRDLDPDVVHHVTLKPIVFGSLAARLAGVPGVVNAFAGLGYIFSRDSLWHRVGRAGLLKLIRISVAHGRHKALFENPDDRALLHDAGAIADADGEVIAGVGVDTDEYFPSPEPSTPVRVLMASRMTREKGVDYFVAAARALKRRGVAARFLLVGRPDPANPGSISAEQLNMWNREGTVEWLGFQRDMPRVVRDAHVVCLPTFYREGVPRILMEGAACARPLVTTYMPGCRDIVRDGINGFVVPPHDAPSLERALERLIADAALRTRFGAAGREIAEREYSLNVVLERLWALYRSAGLADGNA